MSELQIIDDAEVQLVDQSAAPLEISSATINTSPADTDQVLGNRSGWIRWTWTTIKTFLKTYFDTIYLRLNNVKTVGGESIVGTGNIPVGGEETDPIFSEWLSTTPPAYPGDIPTSPEDIGAQPAGNYLTGITTDTDTNITGPLWGDGSKVRQGVPLEDFLPVPTGLTGDSLVKLTTGTVTLDPDVSFTPSPTTGLLGQSVLKVVIFTANGRSSIKDFFVNRYADTTEMLVDLVTIPDGMTSIGILRKKYPAQGGAYFSEYQEIQADATFPIDIWPDELWVPLTTEQSDAAIAGVEAIETDASVYITGIEPAIPGVDFAIAFNLLKDFSEWEPEYDYKRYDKIDVEVLNGGVITRYFLIVLNDYTSGATFNAGNVDFDNCTWVHTEIIPGEETDPVVRAIEGIVKSDGQTISAAVPGTDYLEPYDLNDFSEWEAETLYPAGSKKVWLDLATNTKFYWIVRTEYTSGTDWENGVDLVNSDVISQIDQYGYLTGLLLGDGEGGVSAATADTDYATPSLDEIEFALINSIRY